MTTDKTSKAIGEALLHAQRAIKGVAKDGRNAYQSYDYATCEAMIQQCRSALHDAGLALTRSYSLEYRDGQWLVVGAFTLVLGEQTENFAFAWPAEPGKGRPLDKSVASALSTSLAYFLRDLLLVPRGLGDEQDARDDRDYAPPAPAPAPRQSKPANDEAGRLLAQVGEAKSLEELRALGDIIRHTELPADALQVIRSLYQSRQAELRGDA